MGCKLTSVDSASLFSEVEELTCAHQVLLWDVWLTRSYSGMVWLPHGLTAFSHCQVWWFICFSFCCMEQSCGIDNIVFTVGISELGVIHPGRSPGCRAVEASTLSFSVICPLTFRDRC